MHPPTSETAQRTGPYGRLARLLLAATAGLALASIVDQGGLAAFHGQSLRNEPGLALIAPVMAVVLVSLVGGVATELADDRSARRWRVATLGVLATAVAVAALIGAATGAGAWSSPLIDLVWTLDSLMLTETLIAALLAVVLGTPGCEVGVWPELVARARGRRSPPVTGIACVVGLHALDRWEARRRQCRRQGLALGRAMSAGIAVGPNYRRSDPGQHESTRSPMAVTCAGRCSHPLRRRRTGDHAARGRVRAAGSVAAPQATSGSEMSGNAMSTAPTAAAFLTDLQHLHAAAADDMTPTTTAGPGSQRVPMRAIFALAKTYRNIAPSEIEVLLDQPDHDARVGAVSIMDFQARRASTPPDRRRELYELYVRRHDRIDNWDLIDRSAPHVVGRYLHDKPRDQLYTLARSDRWWERRTAIVATYYFIRHDDLDDTFAIAEILVDDDAELVRKAVGGWIREAGKRDRNRLLAFLDHHAATMPRTTLRYAIGHLTPDEKHHYMNLRTTGATQRADPRSLTDAEQAKDPSTDKEATA